MLYTLEMTVAWCVIYVSQSELRIADSELSRSKLWSAIAIHNSLSDNSADSPLELNDPWLAGDLIPSDKTYRGRIWVDIADGVGHRTGWRHYGWCVH